jgi:hypothetical protein
VRANHHFADEQVKENNRLMKEGNINTCQDDIGHPFRIDTSNVAIVSSWTRTSNSIMVSSTDEMMSVSMTRNQVLRAGVNDTRICISILVLGLLASAFVTSINGSKIVSPLIIDMIPSMKRTKGSSSDDFSMKNGDVSIQAIRSMVTDRISYILKHYDKIFADGADVLKGFMSCICLEKHIVVTLEDEDILRLDPKYNEVRSVIGSDYLFKAFLITHSESGRIIALYHCAHIGSHIGGVSERSLFLVYE